MEAVKDEFVQMKQQSHAADETRQEATPSPSRRVPTQRKDTVEYWVNQDGLPEDFELKKKVIEERRKKHSGNSMFGSPRNLTIK
jgi:hypothetical protein